METPPPNTQQSAEDRLQQFVGKVLEDAAGSLAMLLSWIGDRCGLYRALRDHGPCSSAELASLCDVDERYLREWLSAQAAAGYLEYWPDEERFSLSAEQALVLAEEGHPAHLLGLPQILVAQFSTHEEALDTFRSGKGRPWGAHHPCCFCGTGRFFRSAYAGNLLTNWLPSLNGMSDRLREGARVADVGCGLGWSTLLMAEAFPASRFFGFDLHAESLDEARAEAQRQGLAERVSFQIADAAALPEDNLDLICLFDALHDMGDPVGVARQLRGRLAAGGRLMLVEPLAGDSLSENLHLVGQLYYSASTLMCTPASRAQEVGLALGAQAGERRLTAVLHEAGYTQVRRCAQTESHMVLEVLP